MRSLRLTSHAPRLRSSGVLLAAWLFAGPLAAKTSTVIYAQLLVDHVTFMHSDVVAAGIYSAKPGATEPTLVATASSAVVATFDSTTQTMGDAHLPTVIPQRDTGSCRVLVSLADKPGMDIGILALDFKAVDSKPVGTYLETALEIRNQLQAVIPQQDTLFDPYTKGFDDNDTLAQRITNTLVARHPDINVLAMHLTAPDEKLNRVWGINRPNFIGRPSDEIDTDTEKSGRIVMQVIPATHRMEVHMPMLDRNGALVGTLCTVYFWHDEREAGDLYARSLGIRDEARLLMPKNRDDLFKP